MVRVPSELPTETKQRFHLTNYILIIMNMPLPGRSMGLVTLVADTRISRIAKHVKRLGCAKRRNLVFGIVVFGFYTK